MLHENVPLSAAEDLADSGMKNPSVGFDCAQSTPLLRLVSRDVRMRNPYGAWRKIGTPLHVKERTALFVAFALPASNF